MRYTVLKRIFQKSNDIFEKPHPSNISDNSSRELEHVSFMKSYETLALNNDPLLARIFRSE